MKKLFSLLCLAGVMLAAQAQDTIRIACVGNSITQGVGCKDQKTQSYPACMQRILGDGYKVMNFGLSGHTMMRNGDRPYMNDGKWWRFQKALKSNPDIVTIKLGTNDSKTYNWEKCHEDFIPSLNAMIDSFQALPSKPYIYLCLPIPCAVPEKWTIRDSVIYHEVIPCIQQVAAQRNLPVIDLYAPMKPFPELLVDSVHPSPAGAMLIAEEIARRIMLDMERGLIRYGAQAPYATKKGQAAQKGQATKASAVKVQKGASRAQQNRKK